MKSKVSKIVYNATKRLTTEKFFLFYNVKGKN